MNNEHFWPQWLIRKTKTKGVRFSQTKRVNPKSMKVPLCAACNSAFGGELEDPMSRLLPQIESGAGLSDLDAELLVHWMWKFEGLTWSFDHPELRYTERYTLRDRVLLPLDDIRADLTVAVSLIEVVTQGLADEPMGLNSWTQASAIFGAGVFGRVAIMVLLTKFESEVPPAYSLYRFKDRNASDRGARLFFPKIGFANCTEAVKTSIAYGNWLSLCHDRDMRERIAEEATPRYHQTLDSFD